MQGEAAVAGGSEGRGLDFSRLADGGERRIRTACDMLAAGKRRACCFDCSGIYSKAFSAPEAVEEGGAKGREAVRKSYAVDHAPDDPAPEAH